MRITYLFGAGASCWNSLPTIDKIPERLDHFKRYLDGYSAETSDTKAACESLTADINDVVDAIAIRKTSERPPMEPRWEPKISSIDTYAKQLLLTNETRKLEKLKAVMTLFFTFEQKVRGLDIRYDSFFAALIKDATLKLPDSITIVSWNYDSQFELAFSKYAKGDNVAIRKRLGVFSKGLRTQAPVADTPQFRIYKINGTATFVNTKGIDRDPWMAGASTDSLVEELLKHYLEFSNRELRSTISYSWEDENIYSWEGENVQTDAGNTQENAIHNLALKAVINTDYLVVIGYSFPFFNRAIDQWLIKRMSVLKKVYFQDKYPQKIMTRFRAVRGKMENDQGDKIESIPWEDLDQFALPDELTI
jgi:hypothetical protein